MYKYLLRSVSRSSYPPPSRHIAGLPIKTFEALLHTISTRFSLFMLAKNNCYNTRAISTLAVESFFSDLTRYKFSGLGAPKAVDIPNLISHIVYVNTIKHDPDKGFKFTVSTRDNYPTYFMETDNSNVDVVIFSNHPFDMSHTVHRQKSKKLFKLSKPKQVTKDAKGICQLLTVDETKLTMKQRFGRNITLDECIL